MYHIIYIKTENIAVDEFGRTIISYKVYNNADLLRKYRGTVVIMVGRGGAEPHYVHNWPPIFSW